MRVKSRRRRLVGVDNPNKGAAKDISKALRLLGGENLIATELSLQRRTVDLEAALIEEERDRPTLGLQSGFELSSKCLHPSDVQCTLCIVKRFAHCDDGAPGNLAKMGASYERLGRPKLPEWWTDLAWRKVDQDERNLTELAKAASRIAGRTNAWGGDAISKMRAGSSVTRELANALSAVLGIPQPYFEARSPAESRAISALMESRDDATVPSTNNPETISRRSRIFSALDNTVDDARGQNDPVESSDERSPRSLGSRRALASRTKATRSRS